MKKYFLYLIFCFIFSFSIFAESFTIMSFNLLGAKRGHTKDNLEWINNLTEIITTSKADIVLLQEVPQRYPEEIEKNSFADVLTTSLGSQWYYRTSAMYSNCSYNLNNAILYKDSSVLILREINNSEFDLKYKNVQMIEFSLRKEKEKKFYVINLHLPFDRNNMTHPSNEMRQELNAIKNLVYDRRFPIIFGGDFNMTRRELIRETQFSNSRYTIDGNGSLFYDEQGLLTTVSTSGDAKGIKLASDYDHFIVNNYFVIKKDMRRVFTNLGSNSRNCDKIQIGKNLYTSSVSFMDGVSDHLPIMIIVEY